MQEQNQQIKQNEEQEENKEWIEVKEENPLPKVEIPDPLLPVKKKINKLYAWIWVLLGLCALILLIFILIK